MTGKLYEEEFKKTVSNLQFEIEKINIFSHHSYGPFNSRSFEMLKFHLVLIGDFVKTAEVLTDQLISIEKRRLDP